MDFNPPGPGSSQPPVTLENALNPGSSDHHSGDAKKKCGRETKEEVDSEDNYGGTEDPDNLQTETFPLYQAGDASLKTTFSKQMEPKA